MVVALAAPSLTTLYGAKPDLRAAVIGVSQSGESTDVVEVMQQARRLRRLTIGMTNNPASPLAACGRIPDSSCMPARRRRCRPPRPTRRNWRPLPCSRPTWPGTALLERPGCPARSHASDMLALEPVMAEAAADAATGQHCVCLARGINYATALEAALKLKETCYLGAEPYSTADFMHGPIAVVKPGFPALLFAPPGKAEAAMMEMAQALAERRRHRSSLVARLRRWAWRDAGAMPAEVDELLSPIAYIVPAQLFALHLAQVKGMDPDAPRGLHKVTLTR